MWGIFSSSGVISSRRETARARDALRRVNNEQRSLETLSNEQLMRESTSLRYRAKCGETIDTLLPRGFALVRETAARHLGMRHYDVQILGGALLARGCLAEMATGEGKTLTAALPLYLHALSGKGVHLATANDYLARRDAQWMRPIYSALGLSVGVIQTDSSPAERKAAYACDITYGTAKEFGFDFLRDRLINRDHGVSSDSHRTPTGYDDNEAYQGVQRGLNYALVDEADSILIDEARMPLIISEVEPAASATLAAASTWGAEIVGRLEDHEHYATDPGTSTFRLTPAGRAVIRQAPKPASLADMQAGELFDSVEQAILVQRRFRPEQHYVVLDGEVVVVDEFNGRLAQGRRWRHGLHQAIEAREGLEISPVTGAAAQVTMQEFFLRYQLLAGMSGTILPAAREIKSVYRRPTVAVPLNRPCLRETWPDRVFCTANDKWEAIVAEIQAVRAQGRPVLVGTRSIDKSEHLSQLLDDAAIPHQVLHARHTSTEAERIAAAGRGGQVTVATNLAGRGTDIRLSPGVAELGGLHVIGTELHESPRIDRQLSGRAARQGDPGSCRTFLSLEDDILESAFGADHVEEFRIASKRRSLDRRYAKMFRTAQRIVERRHARQRRQLFKSSRRRQERLERLRLDPFLEVDNDRR